MKKEEEEEEEGSVLMLEGPSGQTALIAEDRTGMRLCLNFPGKPWTSCSMGFAGPDRQRTPPRGDPRERKGCQEKLDAAF